MPPTPPPPSSSPPLPSPSQPQPQTSPSPSQSRPRPPLPLELHTSILHHSPAAPAWPHLAWLWRSCRSANTLTRAAAEQVFIDRHLRRQPRAVQVLFPLGAHAVVVVAEEGGGEWSSTTVYDLEVPMGFVGFEDDDEGEGGGGRGGGVEGGGSMAGRRAVFRDERPAECFGEGVLEETMVQWKEAVGRWAVPGSGDGDGGADEAKGGEEGARKKERGKGYVSLRPEAWRYWVQIRGLALDPELPDLRIDYEKREISFDWRRMLDELFGEEAYARRLMVRPWLSPLVASIL
ncbi:hypothetical protein DBV05_g9910 [Lasiodiplodia theobromae]|uniref:Uncharacterized protein n=1 Tax=Lasiodiplodia theobromae TaxID=45133 RepID=A0A5N5D182_9PEZI|nr:hypothetical protein DBV05_g9910 [Lasiodiplodia theobromae]